MGGDRTADADDRAGIARTRLLACAAVCLVALAVWATARMQHRAADDAFKLERASKDMMRAMLDQQTGLRGYVLTRQQQFLGPYRDGVVRFEQGVVTARALAGPDLRARIDAEVSAARDWQRLAERQLVAVHAGGPSTAPEAGEVVRKDVFDRFRALNAALRDDIERQIDQRLRMAEVSASATVLGVSLLFTLIGYLTIERQAARLRHRRREEQQRRQSHAEFTETMQVMRDETEAHRLVKRQLQRSFDGACVTVMNRNNSDNRLVVVAPTVDDEFEATLATATPDSCLAVRLGRTFHREPGDAPLLGCDLCAAAPAVMCVPSLVGGDVIGAVQLRDSRALTDDAATRVAATVAQAAPVLANLRNLALAETRAATDALTGLPNARACRDTLRRMVAQASRQVSSLSAVMLDLDHFKQINDRFGHGAGDDVLAATGTVLMAALRSSDFAGRSGGEEFLMLLPDTDAEGARMVAEKVRRAIGQIVVPGVDRAITASLGVAAFPADAGTGDDLVRKADRALYMAKGAGRDRVEVVAATPGGDLPAADLPANITDITVDERG